MKSEDILLPSLIEMEVKQAAADLPRSNHAQRAVEEYLERLHGGYLE